VSYVVTTGRGLGTEESSTGVTPGGAVSAATTVVTGFINLIYGNRAANAEREQIAAETSGSFASWQAQREMDALRQQQDREIGEAQNVVLDEQGRQIQEESRRIGLERERLLWEIDREQAAAERQARVAAALSGTPNWFWWALGGVGVVAVVGIAGYLGTRAEES